MSMFHAGILLHVSLIFIKCDMSVKTEFIFVMVSLYIWLYAEKSTLILKYNLQM